MITYLDVPPIQWSFIVTINKIMAYTPTHLDITGQELPIGRLHQEVSRVLKVGVE